jgi:hypothetical protein
MSKNYNSTWSSKKKDYVSLLFPAAKISIDVDYLMHVHSVQSKSHDDVVMSKFLIDELGKIEGVYIESDDYGNIYATKGKTDIYPCMVSHTDTVHSIVDKFKVFRDEDVLFAFNSHTGKQAGIGGDDKVGVFMTLTMLKLFDNFKAVFFRNEEVGCLGSSNCDMSFFNDVSMVLQCDRKGSNDFVDSISSIVLQSSEFKKEVKPILDEHFYKPTTGGMTDVMALKKDNLPVVCANMSCGYYSPHCDDEVVHIPSVENTLNMCFSIFTKLGHRKWEHEYVPYVYKAPAQATPATTTTSNNTNVVDWSRSKKPEDFGLKTSDIEGLNKLSYYDRQRVACYEKYYNGGWEYEAKTGWKKVKVVHPPMKAQEPKKEVKESKKVSVTVPDDYGWRTVNNRFRRYDDEDEPLRYNPRTKAWQRTDGSKPFWNIQQEPEPYVGPSEEVAQTSKYKIVGDLVCQDCGTITDKTSVVSLIQFYCSTCQDYQYIPSENIDDTEVNTEGADYTLDWNGL